MNLAHFATGELLDPVPFGVPNSYLGNNVFAQKRYKPSDIFQPYYNAGLILQIHQAPAGAASIAMLEICMGVPFLFGPPDVAEFDFDIYAAPIAYDPSLNISVPLGDLVGPTPFVLDRPLASTDIFSAPVDGRQSVDITSIYNSVTGRNGVKSVLLVMYPTGGYEFVPDLPSAPKRIMIDTFWYANDLLGHRFTYNP
jgi:hypothetical protein